MPHSVEKLINFCSQNNVPNIVLGNGQEESVLEHLGKTKVIVYTGQNKDKFEELCGTYKAPPVRGAIVYSAYDFGKDVIAIGAIQPRYLYSDLESFQPSVTPSSTTRPPEAVFEKPVETKPTEEVKKWNPNKFFKG